MSLVGNCLDVLSKAFPIAISVSGCALEPMTFFTVKAYIVCSLHWEA